ncbi:MAG: molybdopterin-dependent oxidoreductase [Eggerthellaceae bacterium]|nr:molybdopterin-dependent oxidoreductase [Eggerthellaceae bacterium]
MDSSDFNEQVYKKEWQWKEGDLTVTRSTQWSAPGCHCGCSILFYTDKDGKLVKVEGDPQSPVTNGRLCMRCFALPEAMYHKDRVTTPLKRAREDRGLDKWEPITWDEAYDLIEQNVRQIWEEDGNGRAISVHGGTGRNMMWHKVVAAYACFDSPNVMCGFQSGDACYIPRIHAMQMLCGGTVDADVSQFFPDHFDNPAYKIPDIIVVWGHEPFQAMSDGFYPPLMSDCIKRGSKLMVVDHRVTWLGAKAEVFLQPRPGTDGALALGIINVMIQEDLYDHDFVERWTYGFDELKARAAEYPLERVEEITWVPAEKIARAARFWATGGTSALKWGLVLDEQQCGVGAAHAVLAAEVLTGSIEKPGGTIVAARGYHVDLPYDIDDWCYKIDNIDPDLYKDRVGFGVYPFRSGPNGGYASPDEMVKCLETNEPFQMKMMWFQATNFLACMADEQNRMLKLFDNVRFIMVSDVYMQPTAMAFADLFLPAAFGPERFGLRDWFGPTRSMTQACEPYGDCRSDEQQVFEIGKRLHPERFPWKDTYEFMDFLAHDVNTEEFPNGKRYHLDELREKVIVYPERHYNRHETGELRPDGQPGFDTNTGRIEFFSTMYYGVGLEPLPWYEEPPTSPVSTPELFAEMPYILSTGRRSWEFFHSEHRNLASMREFHPDPLVDMNSEDAAREGIEQGDWIWLENQYGKAKFRANLSDGVLKGTLNAEHAWWFPEKDPNAPSLYGVCESNANQLTSQCQCGPSSYASPKKTQLCKIYKAE